MAFDIHLHIPEDSQRGRVIQTIAEEQHITPEQVVEQIIDEAIRLQSDIKPRIKGLSGQPMSDEDAAVVDEAVDLAMEMRRQRWEQRPGA